MSMFAVSLLFRFQLKHPLFRESSPFSDEWKVAAPSTAPYHPKLLDLCIALTMVWNDLIYLLCIVCLLLQNESCMMAGILSPAASTVPTTSYQGGEVEKIAPCSRALAEGPVVLISSLISARRAVGDPTGCPLLYSNVCLWAGCGSVMGDQ